MKREQLFFFSLCRKQGCSFVCSCTSPVNKGSIAFHKQMDCRSLPDGKGREVLSVLVRSNSLWERRIAIMATFHFIRQGEYTETLKLAAFLLQDPEDLIHKAVGRMLREVGKRDMETEKKFLRRYYDKMPRTMLRYAVEKFPEPERRMYLKGEI